MNSALKCVPLVSATQLVGAGPDHRHQVARHLVRITTAGTLE